MLSYDLLEEMMSFDLPLVSKTFLYSYGVSLSSLPLINGQILSIV